MMPKKLNDDPWEKDIEIYEKIASFIAQPTYLPILITALFYLIISNYYINYFNRLSLPFYTLNLPLTFYLFAGWQLLNVIFALSSLTLAFLIFIDIN